MSVMEGAPALARRPSFLSALAGLVTTPRFLIYACCTLVALLGCYHIGKDAAWDTLDYHFYAGFSALHGRFGQDYFPAGPQSYLNPYALAPFYLLVTSGLTALQVGLVLAAVQSAILWLVYELALTVASPAEPRVHLLLGICATALAFANPLFINQLGSSFPDILTAEIVVAGWLVLVRAVRGPTAMRVVYAALLLGCASALKMTNALHAVAAGVMVLFLPGGWRIRCRYVALFVAAGMVGFALVGAAWCIRLEEHFGNPFFPLLNGLFRSPDFTTAPLVSYRFIPWSLGAALWRPFAMVIPRAMIQVEWAAPDLRYALVLVAAALMLAKWTWQRRFKRAVPADRPAHDGTRRALGALALAFLVDWTLWLTASGNGRYFIPMACIAAVLAVVLIFRLCAGRPKVRNYVLSAVFLVQFYQLHAGTQYAANPPWNSAPWFQVSVPKKLASEPALYFSIGIQSNSFLAPYLAPGSGLINLNGDYTLAPGGASGAHIRALIRRYSPHLRMLMRDMRRDAGQEVALPKMVSENDALEPFGLRLDASSCARIVVIGVGSPAIGTYEGGRPLALTESEANTAYFVSCGVVSVKARNPALVADEMKANVALDRLEDACPALFQPRRAASYLLQDKTKGYIWARHYSSTDMLAWVTKGWVHFQPMLQPEGYAGPESAWQKASPHVDCGRDADGYFLRLTGLR
jgi:hypothetical protein